MSFLRNCRTATTQVRGFTSSTTRRVGPESPNYIEVPRSLQPDLPSKRRVKGTLPVPRDLFPARRADKPTEAYLAAVTPAQTKETKIDPNDPHADFLQWRRQLAEERRQNLREGLQELYSRKQKTTDQMVRKSAEKQQRRAHIFQQPEREDERLTRQSVTQDMLPRKETVLPDPTREARLAQSAERHEYKKALKEFERLNSVQDLYMGARKFITTEAQLAAEIDRIFPEGENEAWRNDHQQGQNVWNLGVPPTVQSLATESRKGEASRWELIQGRVKKLGEQVTGGKL
ncbi:hypothetical protein P168DRAFT_293587 [Aspergillus campestris IBT 28561]|uniref:Uncharacterized protein n=1 Tax=Aspergillus campestris (strain IBT 28561) TaxID=1392248 RepID=A0A2I1CRP9_ASPC2|nr:uncharacterized protein P168DRAFT_293587 [Aspergillus campestris IBT 28561]PKY00303.1 hypothetical protein P168DRAFT_293587 [Aspergillus campestris IBT 28561]